MEYGLIGEKLGHSYSKLIQEKLLDNYTYEIHPLAKEELAPFMEAKAFRAMNVTIPYKQSVLPYLSHISDEAKKIGAVNTVVNKDGELYGYNTDYLGFAYTLDFHNIDVKNKKVLVLGNGGASKAVQAVLLDKQVKQLIVTDLHAKEDVITMQRAYELHSDAEIIVNTTPCGMYPNVEQSAIDVAKFSSCHACVDVIYNPLRTAFLLQARALGIQSVSGLEMLVAQAKYALEFFKDIHIDDAAIDPIYQEILIDTTNIVVVDNEQLATQVALETNKTCITNIEEMEDKALTSSYVLSITSTLEKALQIKLSYNSLWITQATQTNIKQQLIQSIR